MFAVDREEVNKRRDLFERKAIDSIFTANTQTFIFLEPLRCVPFCSAKHNHGSMNIRWQLAETFDNKKFSDGPQAKHIWGLSRFT